MAKKKVFTLGRLSSLPRFFLQLDALCKKAENAGIYAVDSTSPGTVYMCKNEQVLIATVNRGYIRMTEEQAAVLAEELPALLEDLKWRRRAKVG